MENQTITFSVIPYGRTPKSKQFKAYLRKDGWDDFHFKTLFALLVSDTDGFLHEIGGVKIAQFQMDKNKRSPAVPESFVCLDDTFFSLGQDDSYYEKLNELGEEIRNQILTALRDIAADSALFKRAIVEDVTQTSLLRSISSTTVKGQFHRLTQGGARLTNYKFSYKAPRQVATSKPPVELSFEVLAESNPPTNIHVLIGRNGVGKTYLLDLMTRALIEEDASPKSVGAFNSDETDNERLFANLVSVTFSAFDPFEPLPEQRVKSSRMHYSYIGLKRTNNIGGEIGQPKSHETLTREFVKSVNKCLIGARSNRWRRAVKMLEADSIFKAAGVTALIDDINDIEELEKNASSIFKKLSSGHKIVLLTITRLVETVAERTLVLIDEPEAHLHPPLLSAYIRALSDLLIDRNGVAIIATHSPVVLQEVPMSCVWKLRRTGYEATAERPETETFGENVGILTSEVFALEVTQSGFHKLLEQQVELGRNFNSILHYFNNELGAEARAIIRAMVATRDREDQS